MKLSEINIDQLKKGKKIILCLTYDSFDISQLICENITLIYKIDDLYPYNEIRNKCINYAEFLISPYQYLFKENKIIQMYPSINLKKSYHIPYSAVNSFYKNIDFNDNSKEKIFVTGNINNVYPLRQYALQFQQYTERLEHPSYDNYKHRIINKEYYKKLSEYLCCFTDASCYNYILLKVFEISSVGSLLLCDDSIKNQLYNLGFHDNIHYIACNKDNMESKMKWILEKKNRKTVDEIRLKGMDLVRNNHTTSHRSQAFDEIINDIFIMDKNINKKIFSNIYKNGIWNNNNQNIPLSGPGSTLNNTIEVSSLLEEFIYRNKCTSILDLGCGDLTWMSKTKFFLDNNIQYIGIDVVPDLINSHKMNYPDNTFLCKDITEFSEFSKVSMIILRDVIFHLENYKILNILNNIKNKFDFICITSCKNTINNDNFNKWRFSEKNIHIKPFNIPYTYKCKVFEKEFDRNLYIYEHYNFYSV